MNINIPIRILDGVENKKLPSGGTFLSVKFISDDGQKGRVNFIPTPTKKEPEISRIDDKD